MIELKYEDGKVEEINFPKSLDMEYQRKAFIIRHHKFNRERLHGKLISPNIENTNFGGKPIGTHSNFKENWDGCDGKND